VFAVFRQAAGRIWNCVCAWDQFGQETVGKQLVRAADSIGANLVEGDGRYGSGEAIQFFRIARASARETRYWLWIARDRDLIPVSLANELIEQVVSATRQLNGLIRYRNMYRGRGVREVVGQYNANSAASTDLTQTSPTLDADLPDPFSQHLTLNTQYSPEG
jgi:four helix bundle protein